MAASRASFAEPYVVALDPEQSDTESSTVKTEVVDLVSSEQEAFAFTTPGSGVSRRSRPTRGTRSRNMSQQRSGLSPIGMEWSPLATSLSDETATKLRFDPSPTKEEPEGSTAAILINDESRTAHHDSCESSSVQQTQRGFPTTTSEGTVPTAGSRAPDLQTPLPDIQFSFAGSGSAFMTSAPGEKASRGRKNSSGARNFAGPGVVPKVNSRPEPKWDSILAWPSTSGTTSPGKNKRDSMSPGKARHLDWVQKAAERLRREGNTAFGERKWQRARELYTEAIELLSEERQALGNALGTQLAPLLANRAATWLSLGLPHKAIEDCLLGLSKSPGNLRCGVRLATCHLRLGDFPAALGALQKLEGELPDSTKTEEDYSSVENKRQEICTCARELAAALQQLANPCELPVDAVELFFGLSYHDLFLGGGSSAFQTSTTDQETSAVLDRLHSTVPHSAVLLAARAACLIRLGQYLEANRIARQSLTGFGKLEADTLQKEAWRLWILAQTSHAAGELEETVAQLEDLQRLMDKKKKNGLDAAQLDGRQAVDDSGEEITRSSSAENMLLACVLGLPHEPSEFISPLRDAMQLKQQGNANVAASKFELAVDLYTKALVPALPPRAAAVLFCNRAAAYLGGRQLAQAVADAARAACLAPDYAKAHSRLAAALEQVKRYSESADALEKALRCPDLAAQERKAYRQRLSAVRQRQSSAVADHYGLLGVARGCSNDDVKRAFKKLALQLHPDKLAHSVQVMPVLSINEASRSGCLPEDARTRLQESATWLFKCLGEASDVLCDPVRRRELDRKLFPAANATADARWRPESYGPFGPSGSTWNTRPVPHHFYHHSSSRRDQTWSSMFGSRF